MTEYPVQTPPSSEIPSASEFTSSPLRNRLRVELDAPVPEVWELIGDLSRFPEYSMGLERVEATTDENGRCIEYTCYFKPLESGSEGAVSHDVMKWYEPNRGYLSVEVDGTWGGGGAVALLTLDPIPGGTRVTNDMHFESEDLEAAKAHIDEALVVIAENLIARFGGEADGALYRGVARLMSTRSTDLLGAPPRATVKRSRSSFARSSIPCTAWRFASSATRTTPKTLAKRS